MIKRFLWNDYDGTQGPIGLPPVKLFFSVFRFSLLRLSGCYIQNKFIDNKMT